MSMIGPSAPRLSRWSVALFLGLLAGFVFLPGSAEADISTDHGVAACPGSVCSSSITVSGHQVRMQYTQHITSDGQLKIRFNGGSYPSTSDQISFIVYDAPRFTQASAYTNPIGANTIPPEEATNGGQTAYERRMPTGCGGCNIDFVVSLRYAGLAPGEYTFSFYVFQLGGSGSKSNYKFYVDADSPSNVDESESLDAVLSQPPGSYLVCADTSGGQPIDNDLNFYPNCADDNCDGLQGDPANSSHLCEAEEITCDDGFDNDGDGDTDCQDQSCHGRCGEWNASKTLCQGYCQYRNEYGTNVAILDGSTPDPDALSPCTDGFDNDGDGRGDCHDNRQESFTGTETFFTTLPDVQANPGATICWRQPAYGCPLHEQDCADGYDDDVDIKYSDDEYDPVIPSSGPDCRDYDCAGNPACPSQENRLADGTDAPAQCFDGDDNDLDHLIDCADPDCIGVENPSQTDQICSDKELDLGQKIMLCNDFLGGAPFDNDGDGPPNCRDSDCYQKFGHCQWCPAHEDYRYDACSDGEDNDADGSDDPADGEFDCFDIDCDDRVGRSAGAAYCRNTETEKDSFMQCGDGLDNDADGELDCLDTNCDSQSTQFWPDYPSFKCSRTGEKTASLCSDMSDNDMDDGQTNGGYDCLDKDCWGLASCAVQDWQLASCISVPEISPPTRIAGPDGTVTAQVMTKSRVGQQHTIRIQGSGNYPDFAIFVGTAVDPTHYYPYADLDDPVDPFDSFCTVSDANFRMTGVEGKALMILAENPVTSPDFTVTCDLPSVPTDTVTFSIALSATTGSGLPEYGEIDFSNRVYEDLAPTVTEVEVEGENPGAGLLRVPYGSARQFRLIPDEPNDGAPPADTYDADYTSGICRCNLVLDDSSPTDRREFQSADGNCLVEPRIDGGGNPVLPPAGTALQFLRRRANDVAEGPLELNGYAEDGAANLGPQSVPRLITVDVTPIVAPGGDLEITTPDGTGATLSPFFNSQLNQQARLSATFWTALNVGFTTNLCQVDFLQDGALIDSVDILGIPSGNVIDCVGVVTVPASMMSDQNKPGNVNLHYYTRVSAVDQIGNRAYTGRREIYFCDSLPTAADGAGYNPCHWADFDNDGATEGYFTDLYTRVSGLPPGIDPVYRACDNCVGIANPLQGDWDLDGIGDLCTEKGRCEVDREYVCDYFSYDYTPETADTCKSQEYQGITQDMCCLDSADTTCCPKPAWTLDASTGEPIGTCWDNSTGLPADIDGIPGVETCVTSADCGTGEPDYLCMPQQACNPDWGVCSVTGLICFYDEECPLMGACVDGAGTPAPLPNDCRQDSDCTFPGFATCLGGERCVGLIYPWLESDRGNVFSGNKIRSRAVPPENTYNATFCITAKYGVQTISISPTETEPVFRTELCPKESPEDQMDLRTEIERPKSDNYYGTVLGRLDVEGLLAGKYGEVVELAANKFNSQFPPYQNQALGGKVYVVNGDLTVDRPAIGSEALIDGPTKSTAGNGTVVVVGGNLRLNGNYHYQVGHAVGIESTQQIASLGWIVLEDPDTKTGGNIYIDHTVTELVGAFFAGGQSGLHTVGPPETDSPNPLTVRGLALARQFHLSRSYRSEERGSEQFVYDGRALINPPPGFEDLTKSLPIFGIAPPLP